MKLAKKMLASVIALAMVAALALTAFAAAPVVSMNNASAKVGETVTITVSGAGIEGLESADLRVNYDAEALEFVSAKGAAGVEYGMSVGGNPEAGLATFSFAFMDAATADSDMAVLTFKVLKTGDSEVKLWFYSWDGTETPADVTATVTGIEEKPTETTTVKEDPTTTTTTEPAPVEPTSAVDTTKKPGSITQTGEAGVAAIAGVMALAAVAFVATRKKDEE